MRENPQVALVDRCDAIANRKAMVVHLHQSPCRCEVGMSKSPELVHEPTSGRTSTTGRSTVKITMPTAALTAAIMRNGGGRPILSGAGRLTGGVDRLS